MTQGDALAARPGPCFSALMQLTCPACGAVYDVPDTAIGPNGRRVRCRACDTSWMEPGRSPPPVEAPPSPPPPEPFVAPVALDPPAQGVSPPYRRRGPVPWFLLALGVAVVALGVIASILVFGRDKVATRLGLAEQRVPLGIAITREPDWQLIAGGSQLFAVSGRIWNPTGTPQSVPDIRAELKDRSGRTVYGWTIIRPVATLAPGASATFDGAAVNVPASSTKVSVSFAGTD